MPFLFSWFCDLLEEVRKNRSRHVTAGARGQNPDDRVIISWFNRFDSKIQRTGPSAVALLSAFFPERRVDRVYGLQEKRLSAIFGRALGLGYRRAQELNQWRQRDGLDFATCVERVMAQCEFDVPPPGHEVTLEEVDCMLHQLAANSPFSSPKIRASRNDENIDKILTPVLRRLHSRDAKWLVRMILKSYVEIQLPERLILNCFHFLMTRLLSIQNSLEAAVDTLDQASIVSVPARPSKEYEPALLTLLAREVSPKLGVMIQRQPYFKARSIKHCSSMANQRQMSVERKYDGEYCQVHVDLSNQRHPIQIFSKSGKDSTNDRIGIHGAIKDCLRIDQVDCRFQRRCILEGELLVWSSYRKCILPFHKIRKYVQHGGRRLGTAADSPLRSDEHLIIAFFDILLRDEKLLLNEPLTARRHHLESITHVIEGRCVLGERSLIDFSAGDASTKLREAFAKAITDRWEGFVLKACNEAYFSWASATHGIKLKKDYIAGLGDSADLCVVGGRRDARIEMEIGLGSLRWTSFHVGCIVNKGDVHRFDAKPRFKVLDELTHHSMSKVELLDLNRLGQYHEMAYSASASPLDLEFLRKDLEKPTEVFQQPFIIEIVGAGYSRPSDCDYYTLRFPRKMDGRVKLHNDRNITDTTSFDDLQNLAQVSLNTSVDPDLREDEMWIQKLLQADGKSQNTRATSDLASPRKEDRAVCNSQSPLANYSAQLHRPVFVRADTEDLIEEEPNNDKQKSIRQVTHSEKSLQNLTMSASSSNQSLKRASEALGELKQPLLKKKRFVETHPSSEPENINVNSGVPASITADCSGVNQQAHKETNSVSYKSFVAESIEPATCHSVTMANASIATPPSSTDHPDMAPSMHENQVAQPASETAEVVSALNDQQVTPANSAKSTSLSTLQTPPSSNQNQSVAAEEKKAATVNLVAETHQLTTEDTAIEQQLNSVTPAVPQKTMESSLAVPIYVPSSVSGTDRRIEKKWLYDRLREMKVSHTQDLSHFIDEIDKVALKQQEETTTKKTYHIILLDFDNPPAAKEDLDGLFNDLIAHERVRLYYLAKENPGIQVNTDPCSWLKDNVMIWDMSLLHHWKKRREALQQAQTQAQAQAHSTTPELNESLDLNVLASLKDDPVGSELFGGWLRVRQDVWLAQGKLMCYLVKNWEWMDTLI